MNKTLYKKIIIAMMVTSISAVSGAAFAAGNDVRPVDLSQADQVMARAKAQQQEIKQEKAQQKRAAKAEAKARKAAEAVAPVDITPQLREELAQQIIDNTAKYADKAAKERQKTGEKDPVIAIGRVPENSTLDLNLPKTVQMALDYNRDIKNSQYSLKEAEYAINEARAGKSPVVDYAYDVARNRPSDANLASRLSNSFSNGVTVNIPLYTGGRVEGNIERARLGKTNAQEEILRVEQLTKYNAVQAYYALLAYQELRDIYHESVSNLQGHLDNVTAQYNVGTVARLDVLTSDVSLANSKTDAVNADNDVAVAESNLDNVIGLPLQTKLNLADHQLPFDTYNISLEEATDYAMKYRPEILQAAVAVQQAEEYINVQKAADRPQVSITGGNTWAGQIFSDSYDANHRGWNIGAGVTYNFYDGGATKAKVDQAKQQLLIARETEQQTRESVQLEVKQAYLNIRSAAQRVEATQTSVAQAEESFKIARIRYQAGVGINLDVLDAQLNLNRAQVNHIQALYDYNVGIAKLEQVMGVDVESGVIHPSLTATTYRG